MAKTRRLEKVLVFSDAHSQRSAWNDHPVNGDAAYALEQIADFAIEHNVAAVIGAGDLIDQQRNRAYPIAIIASFLDRLEDAGIPFYYIEGQHELDTPPWLSCHVHAQHLGGKMVRIGDLNYYGMNFTHADELQAELAKIPKTADVLICHQVWHDFMGELAQCQGRLADIPHVSCVVTGDFHETHELEVRGTDGRKFTVISPGSTCLQSINEPEDKHFFTIDDNMNIERHDLRSRIRIKTQLLITTEDLDELIASLPDLLAKARRDARDLDEQLQKPLLWVHYLHKLTDTTARVRKVVGDNAFIFFREYSPDEDEVASVEDKSEFEVPQQLKASKMLRAIDVVGSVVDKTEEPEAYKLVIRLLDSNDYQATLTTWRAEFLAARGSNVG